MAALKYVGNGSFLAGVPARDLEQDELDNSLLSVDELVRTGLYSLDFGTEAAQEASASKASKAKAKAEADQKVAADEKAATDPASDPKASADQAPAPEEKPTEK